MTRLPYLLCVLCLTLFWWHSSAIALDIVKVAGKNGDITHTGRIIAKDSDNSLAIELRDGQVLLFEGDEILEEAENGEEFVPYTKEEMKLRLQAEFPRNFSIYESKHYLIVHNTSNVYAAWSAQLFEKLYAAFFRYWKAKKIDLAEPEYPLVVVIFASQREFTEYAKRDLGDNVPNALRAYYQKHSNRIFMYDITETAAALGNANRVTNREISVILNQPGAELNVSTIIHEATHQVAFNSGLQQRFSAYPLWLCEGLAMMFETPRMDRGGWIAGIRMNERRVHTLAMYLQARPEDPLRAIVLSDSPLQKGNVGSISNAYAVSWGLTYYLAMKRPADFQKYIRLMAEKENFLNESPEQRLKDFEEIFGDKWSALLNAMIKFYDAELKKMQRN